MQLESASVSRWRNSCWILRGWSRRHPEILWSTDVIRSLTEGGWCYTVRYCTSGCGVMAWKEIKTLNFSPIKIWNQLLQMIMKQASHSSISASSAISAKHWICSVLRKLSGAHLSALHTPPPGERAAQTLLSTVYTSPSCLSSIFHSVWSYPSGRGCPLWKRKSEAWPSRTSPSSNPQSRPHSAGGLVGDVTEAVCLLTPSRGVNLYRSRGGFSPTAQTSEEGGPVGCSQVCSCLQWPV